MTSCILPCDISYSYVLKGAFARVSGFVTNGGVGHKKAFVCVVKIYDKSGQLIDGPYDGMGYSRLGAYRYIEGGSMAAPAPYLLKIRLPENAHKLTITFMPWDCETLIQLAEPPMLEIAKILPAQYAAA